MLISITVNWIEKKCAQKKSTNIVNDSEEWRGKVIKTIKSSLNSSEVAQIALAHT